MTAPNGAFPAAPRKTCSKCGETSGDFGKDRSTNDGLRAWCRPCDKAKAQAYRAKRGADVRARRRAEYQANKGKYLARNRANMYGLEPGQYEELADRQSGVCAICREPCASGNSLAVDHDHACCSGRKSCGNCIRGLLCSACNRGLAAFRDDPSRLSAAITYLGGVA